MAAPLPSFAYRKIEQETMMEKPNPSEKQHFHARQIAAALMTSNRPDSEKNNNNTDDDDIIYFFPTLDHQNQTTSISW